VSETFAFRSPDALSDPWGDAVHWRRLPKFTFHALRRSPARALIAHGVDVLTVSQRFGHANVHAHATDRQKDKATAALDAGFGSDRHPMGPDWVQRVSCSLVVPAFAGVLTIDSGRVSSPVGRAVFKCA
jgi:hypothetical protein